MWRFQDVVVNQAQEVWSLAEALVPRKLMSVRWSKQPHWRVRLPTPVPVVFLDLRVSL